MNKLASKFQSHRRLRSMPVQLGDFLSAFLFLYNSISSTEGWKIGWYTFLLAVKQIGWYTFFLLAVVKKIGSHYMSSCYIL